MTLAPTTPATVAGAFLDTVARTPDAVALRGGDRTLTWEQLAEAVARTAGALRAFGVLPGDTVATLVTNRPEQWIFDLAITFCGATVCPLYTTLAPNDIAFITRDAGAWLVVTERALYDGVRRAGVEHAIVVEDFAAGAPLDLRSATIDPDAVASRPPWSSSRRTAATRPVPRSAPVCSGSASSRRANPCRRRWRPRSRAPTRPCSPACARGSGSTGP